MQMKYQPAEALESIEDVSDSPSRELFIKRHELVALNIDLQSADAWKIFNTMDVKLLPRLPHAYRWTQVNDNKESKYAVIRDKSTKEHALTLVLYGPDNNKKINYIFQVDGKTTFSFAHTRTTKEPKRDYPMSNDAYRVPGFNYSTHAYKQHVRGHLIDHKDTIQEVRPSSAWSTYDKRAYIPEPPDYAWGMGFRNNKVAEIRRSSDKLAYSQFMEYSDSSLKTINGTYVPDATYFSIYAFKKGNYDLEEVYNVEWEEDFSRPNANIKYTEHAKNKFTTSVEAAPIVAEYSPNSTDRTLRLLARNSARKAADISSKNIRSRFVNKDGLYAHGDAADLEVYGVNRQIHTAHFANHVDDEELSLEYVRRALDFGADQLELDEKKPILDSTARKLGITLFNDKEDDNGFQDSFNKLWKDQPRSLSSS